MKKQQWVRIDEPSEGLVHFQGNGVCDQATLCGLADWLGRRDRRDGTITKKDVNCLGCLSIVEQILTCGWPRELKSGTPPA